MAPIERRLLFDSNALKIYLEKEKPDYIFHLAAYGNMSNQKDEQEIFNTNVIGTWNMLMASKSIDYKKFINFSTSSVLLSYETFYSASKAASERLANAFLQQGKPILTVRPYSIYGEGEADFRFIPTAIKCLLKNQPLNLDPRAYHDWVHIDDFIGELWLMTKSNRKGVWPLGTGKKYSNEEVLRLLEKISGLKAIRVITKLRSFDTTNWVSPQSTVRSDLEKGLRKTFEYYKSLYRV